MADKLVTIATFENYIEADLAKQVLEDFGIKLVVTGENAANVFSFPAIATITMQTFESQAQKAREILESNKTQES